MSEKKPKTTGISGAGSYTIDELTNFRAALVGADVAATDGRDAVRQAEQLVQLL